VKEMGNRIFEETAVIIKQKYTVRFLEYKEGESEFTEISVYGKELTEKDDEISDYFAFGFTVKGRGEEEKEKIDKMNETQFEEFIKHMTQFIERKYNIVHKTEVKKEEKPVENKPDVDINIDWNEPIEPI
jgi:hypothetical protein